MKVAGPIVWQTPTPQPASALSRWSGGDHTRSWRGSNGDSRRTPDGTAQSGSGGSASSLTQLSRMQSTGTCGSRLRVGPAGGACGLSEAGLRAGGLDPDVDAARGDGSGQRQDALVADGRAGGDAPPGPGDHTLPVLDVLPYCDPFEGRRPVGVFRDRRTVHLPYPLSELGRFDGTRGVGTAMSTSRPRAHRGGGQTARRGRPAHRDPPRERRGTRCQDRTAHPRPRRRHEPGSVTGRLHSFAAPMSMTGSAEKGSLAPAQPSRPRPCR